VLIHLKGDYIIILV